MDKIASFTVNHLQLESGLYISRQDQKNGQTVTTFDLRFTMPNREEPMDISSIHTIEHLGATYLRNSKRKDDIVYFGPMGCRTGFYLIVFGDETPETVMNLVLETLEFIINFEGEIPGHACPRKQYDICRNPFHFKNSCTSPAKLTYFSV